VKKANRNQRRRANHDVAIDRDHAYELVALDDHRRIDPDAAEQQPGDAEPRRQADDLRRHRRSRGARDAIAEDQHQQDGHRHVDGVDHDLQRQRRAGAGDADQPTEEGKVCKRARRRPYPHDEIARGCGLGGVAATHETEDRQCDRRLKRNKQEPDDNGDQQGPHQNGALFDLVACALGLGGARHRPHAQEAEQPEHAVEYERRHGDAAEQTRLAELSDRGSCHQAEQRRGQVGNHRRPAIENTRALVTGAGGEGGGTIIRRSKTFASAYVETYGRKSMPLVYHYRRVETAAGGWR
jgi:hypothetical protein